MHKRRGKPTNKPVENSVRYPFIAEHRGGPLTRENQIRLCRWARECSERVLPLVGKVIDKRLTHALQVAREWENGNVPTGEAMKASLGAHAAAREAKDPVSKAVARAIGQAVATAHMADHSLGGAFYALKALKLAHGNTDKERDWQVKKLEELPSELGGIVQDMWKRKELDRRINSA